MVVGDTVQVAQTGMVGVIVESVDKVIGSHIDNHPRWVVRLAYTMRRHIFLQRDLEIISTHTKGGRYDEQDS